MFRLIQIASACAKVNPKVKPNNTILPNSSSAVRVNSLPAPTLINSNTNTATKAPMGSIRIPSHLRMAEISFFSGILRKIGVITVGPVTMIKAANKNEIRRLRSKI